METRCCPSISLLATLGGYAVQNGSDNTAPRTGACVPLPAAAGNWVSAMPPAVPDAGSGHLDSWLADLC